MAVKKDRECDRRNRRDNRLGTVIAIIAILGTVCNFLFQCAKSAVSSWPESGYLYSVALYSVYFVPLSAIVLICYDIICYVIKDLNRYDVQNKSYMKYDKESDQRYSFMVKDFKIMLGVLFAELIITALIISYYQKSINGLMCFIVVILCLIISIIYFVKYHIYKNIKWIEVKAVMKRIGIFLLVTLCIFYFVISFVINKGAKVDIKFDEEGGITIENSIDEKFDTASVYVNLNNKKIANKHISVKDLLVANETCGQSFYNNSGEEIEKTLNIPEEMNYWKYRYSMAELNLSNGTYNVVILIKQKSKSVRIENMFEVEDGKYIFCKNSMSKRY